MKLRLWIWQTWTYTWPFVWTLGILIFFSPGTIKAQSIQTIADWSYIPLSPALYQKFEAQKEAQKVTQKETYRQENKKIDREWIDELFDIAEKNKSSLIGSEAEVFLSDYCLHHKMYYCAYYYSLKTVSNFPGSMPSFLALEGLSKLLTEIDFFDKEIEDELSKGSFIELPNQSLNFINYFVTKNNYKLGFIEWTKNSWTQVTNNNLSNNIWNLRLQFLAAVDLVKKNKIDLAFEKFEGIKKNIQSDDQLQFKTSLQIARLKFEKGDLDRAESIYSELTAEPKQDAPLDPNLEPNAEPNLESKVNFRPQSRIRGRILLEQAWIQYFKKDYGAALGLLHSLKAPSFRQSLSPEQFKLQILILRELCYFSEIQKVVKEFRQTYSDTFRLIESGEDLTSSAQLTNGVFQNAEWLPRANTLSQINTELEMMEQIFPKDSKFRIHYSKLLATHKRQMSDELASQIKEKVEIVARDLLNVREQISLLEYLAGLDLIKPNLGRKKVKAESISYYAIETLYWPQESEYWRDEFENTKVLISDRCQQ